MSFTKSEVIALVRQAYLEGRIDGRREVVRRVRGPMRQSGAVTYMSDWIDDQIDDGPRIRDLLAASDLP